MAKSKYGLCTLETPCEQSSQGVVVSVDDDHVRVAHVNDIVDVAVTEGETVHVKKIVCSPSKVPGSHDALAIHFHSFRQTETPSQ